MPKAVNTNISQQNYVKRNISAKYSDQLKVLPDIIENNTIKFANPCKNQITNSLVSYFNHKYIYEYLNTEF